MTIFNTKPKGPLCKCGCGTELSNPFRSFVSGHNARIMTEETKKRMSVSRTGITFSEKTRQNMSEAQKLRYKNPRESKKISKTLMGHKVSSETRQRISDSVKQAYIKDPTYIKRCVTSRAGYIPSNSTRKRISKAVKQAHINDPTIAKRISQSHIGQIRSNEAKQHMSEAQQLRWKDPSQHKKASKIRTGMYHTEESIQKMCESHRQSHLNDPTIGDRLSKALTGRSLSDKHKQHISKALKQAHIKNPAIAERISKSNLGQSRSAEQRQHMSEAQYLRYKDPKERAKTGKTHAGTHYSDKIKQRMSKAQLKSFQNNPERVKRHSEAMTGYVPSKKTKKLMSKIQKNIWKNLSSEEKTKKVQTWCSGQNRRPTKTETLLDKWLQKDFPGEWKYVGDGEVRIGTKNPDFINVNGKKAVIELFGYYWHGPAKISGGTRSETGTIEYYKKYGFNCLVIWADNADDLTQNWTTIVDWIKKK